MDLRVALSIVALAVTLYAGAWVRAEYVLADRVRQVALGAQGACAAGGRGTASSAPTAESIGMRFRALAADHALEASEVDVQLQPLAPGQAGVGLGAAIVDQLALATGGKVKMDATQVTVRARLQGEQWLWSVDQPFETSCFWRGKIERVMPAMPGP